MSQKTYYCALKSVSTDQNQLSNLNNNKNEKKITSFNDELKVGTYKASECFVSYQYLSFTGMRLELENLEERRPFNLNYISLMTPKEAKQDTPSPRPLSRTNFYKNSFT